jgi:hypothetical protein
MVNDQKETAGLKKRMRLKPAKNRVKTFEKAKVKAHLEETAKFEENFLTKHPLLWIRKMFETHLNDLPEWIAIAGLTIVVKGTIDATEDLVTRVKRALSPIQQASPEEQQELKAYFTETFQQNVPPQVLGKLVGKYNEQGRFEFLADWQEWLVAFSIAYILVKHGGQIIGLLGDVIKSGGGSLSAIIPFLLPA